MLRPRSQDTPSCGEARHHPQAVVGHPPRWTEVQTHAAQRGRRGARVKLPDRPQGPGEEAQRCGYYAVKEKYSGAATTP
eukprot:4492671-Heterocapsa_arctica.AAC.1